MGISEEEEDCSNRFQALWPVSDHTNPPPVERTYWVSAHVGRRVGHFVLHSHCLARGWVVSKPVQTWRCLNVSLIMRLTFLFLSASKASWIARGTEEAC